MDELNYLFDLPAFQKKKHPLSIALSSKKNLGIRKYIQGIMNIETGNLNLWPDEIIEIQH